MRYSDVEKRLAMLEHDEEERQNRVYDRVLQQLTNSELDCYIVFLERWIAGQSTRTTTHEQTVLQRVYDLTRADPEARQVDWLNAHALQGGQYV